MKILCVGRGYIGKALGKEKDFEAMPHTYFIENPDCVRSFDAIVNTAGIIGDGKCQKADYSDVIEANVEFPRRMQAYVLKHKKQFIHLSTVGISEVQVAPPNSAYGNDEPPFYVTEHMPVYPHNLYCASKILSEEAVKKRKNIIFRLPWMFIKGVIEDRIQNWDFIQDTWCSYVTIQTLATAIRHATQGTVIGTYHLSDGHVYFPDFIREKIGQSLPTRTDCPKAMTAAVPVGTVKTFGRVDHPLTGKSKKIWDD